MGQCVFKAQWEPPVFQVGTPLLQGDPPKLQILLSCLELASTAPDFSLRMNCYDSKVCLQGSSEGPHGSSESLCCSKVTLYSPELAFRGSGLASTD